ncbi:nuclear transport factor 2 family protein [Fulvivirgaceae bacterium BMA12]|uniref:Nuclear transport factor 2 family protein n=1 Tax=Agaribacillus aureus TaxID=3051825 RepID=A0ABT8L502_9BACT|nr:nuclear transport factor 2 family protein [Fulvivirgaceae bacterium BMA12]
MRIITVVLTACSLVLSACNDNKEATNQSGSVASDYLNSKQFRQLLWRVAEGWNNGDARAAADCFTKDAVYIEPPDQQLYQGRDELFEFFGGTEGRADPMNMTWHHLIFDEEQQIGTGEYTFVYKGRLSHGIVIVHLSKGKIRRWREYQYRSTTKWADFIGQSAF